MKNWHVSFDFDRLQKIGTLPYLKVTMGFIAKKKLSLKSVAFRNLFCFRGLQQTSQAPRPGYTETITTTPQCKWCSVVWQVRTIKPACIYQLILVLWLVWVFLKQFIWTGTTYVYFICFKLEIFFLAESKQHFSSLHDRTGEAWERLDRWKTIFHCSVKLMQNRSTECIVCDSRIFMQFLWNC